MIAPLPKGLPFHLCACLLLVVLNAHYEVFTIWKPPPFFLLLISLLYAFVRRFRFFQSRVLCTTVENCPEDQKRTYLN